MFVQKLRLQQGWSQQQLADASGRSVRTIQRIEAGRPASTETLKSLAAVFEVDFTTLDPEQAMPDIAQDPDQQQEAEALKYVRDLKGFYLHLFKYVIITSALLVINLTFTPQYLWVAWVFGGWGLGVLFHAFRVLNPDWILGPQWERRQVEKRLGKPL